MSCIPKTFIYYQKSAVEQSVPWYIILYLVKSSLALLEPIYLDLRCDGGKSFRRDYGSTLFPIQYAIVCLGIFPDLEWYSKSTA
ncbi:9911_t:CDS:1, partial [Dentiscutata erythropus]